jgi:hypothetical protein
MSTDYNNLKNKLPSLLTQEQLNDLASSTGARPGDIELMESSNSVFRWMEKSALLSYNDVAMLRELLSNTNPRPQEAVTLIDDYIYQKLCGVEVPDKHVLESYLKPRLEAGHRLITEKNEDYKIRYIKKGMLCYTAVLRMDLCSELTKSQLIELASKYAINPKPYNYFKDCDSRCNFFEDLDIRKVFTRENVLKLADILDEMKAYVAANLVRQYHKQYLMA